MNKRYIISETGIVTLVSKTDLTPAKIIEGKDAAKVGKKKNINPNTKSK